MKVEELHRKVKITKPKAEMEALIKKMRAEDEKMVKGQFEFVDAEGGFFVFTWRKFPGDPIQTYQFIHGEICEVPMGIVKHLNGIKKKIRRYKDVEQPSNGPLRTPRTFETTSRVRFVPTDFI